MSKRWHHNLGGDSDAYVAHLSDNVATTTVLNRSVQYTYDGEHRRVAFDIEAVARDYHAVGFPSAAHAAQQLLAARYG